MPRRPVEDRIAALQKQQAKLRARERTLKAQATVQRRKDDARRRILLGQAIEALWNDRADLRQAILEELSNHMSRDRDKRLIKAFVDSMNE